MQTLVIGGGIAGLACAFRLKQLGIPVRLIECGPRPGGVIASLRQDNFLFELGPQSFLTSPALLETLSVLDLDSELIRANPKAPRFIYSGGRLQPVPMSPSALLTTSLLSWRTKLRLLSEPFRRSKPPPGDESLAAFVRRKFGNDLLENVAGPFASGIYAGDPEQLSLRAAFPQVHQWELEFGSVVKGAMLPRLPKLREGHARLPSRYFGIRELCSFRSGMGAFPEAFARHLGDALHLGVAAETVRAAKVNGHSGLEVRVIDHRRNQSLACDAVVLATPAATTSRILAGLSANLADQLQAIPYAPVAVVGVAYQRGQVSHGLDGFGFLVPLPKLRDGLPVLGTVWNSSLFPGRTPEGHVLLTSFLGGAAAPEWAGRNDVELTAAVEATLARVLGVRGTPVARNIQRHPHALPQYNLGHSTRLATLQAELARLPGVFLAGNFLEGPSIANTLEQAFRTADSVQRYLHSA